MLETSNDEAWSLFPLQCLSLSIQSHYYFFGFVLCAMIFILHNSFSTHSTSKGQSIPFRTQKSWVSENFMWKQENKFSFPYFLTCSHSFFPNPNMPSFTSMEMSEKLIGTSVLTLMNEKINVAFYKDLYDSKIASL